MTENKLRVVCVIVNVLIYEGLLESRSCRPNMFVVHLCPGKSSWGTVEPWLDAQDNIVVLSANLYFQVPVGVFYFAHWVWADVYLSLSLYSHFSGLRSEFSLLRQFFYPKFGCCPIRNCMFFLDIACWVWWTTMDFVWVPLNRSFSGWGRGLVHCSRRGFSQYQPKFA